MTALRLPPVGGNIPRRGNRFTRALGRAVLRLFGWRVEGDLADVPRAIVIGAPHTSNWDFVGSVGAMLALGLDVGWMGKHTLFRWPFGRLMRRLGGIPVNRGAAAGVARDSVEAFRRRERLWLAIAPEGTRRSGGTWKSGFYRIARAADVPVLMVVLDARRRRIAVGPLLRPGADPEADWQRLRDFYEPHLARYGRSLQR